jgi:hypothetical protein
MGIITISNTSPQRCGTALVPSKLDVQVLSAAGIFVRIGGSRDELATPLPFGGNQGTTFDSSAGLVERQWLGEVWIVGLASNASQPVIEVSVIPN